VKLAVVLSTTEAQTAAVVEQLGLNYPIYSDESWGIFRAFGTGHVLAAPRQAWVVIDGDGIVRWTWRSGQRDAGPAVPMPRHVLEVVDDLFGAPGPA
jgi:peroxiredoxin